MTYIPEGAIGFPGGIDGTWTLSEHTSDHTITEGESGTFFSKEQDGFTNITNFYLPNPVTAGTHFAFMHQNDTGGPIRIWPGVGSTILDDSGLNVNKFKWTDEFGACTVYVADSRGNWVVKSKWGDWRQQL
jgi:hypothetical protein